MVTRPNASYVTFLVAQGRWDGSMSVAMTDRPDNRAAVLWQNLSLRVRLWLVRLSTWCLKLLLRVKGQMLPPSRDKVAEVAGPLLEKCETEGAKGRTELFCLRAWDLAASPRERDAEILREAMKDRRNDGEEPDEKDIRDKLHFLADRWRKLYPECIPPEYLSPDGVAASVPSRSQEQLMADFEAAAKHVAQPFIHEGRDEENAQIVALSRGVYEIAGLSRKQRDGRKRELVKTVCPHGKRYRSMLADILDDLMARWRKLYPDMVPRPKEVEKACRIAGGTDAAAEHRTEAP